MARYRIKNYKGNLVESLKSFQKKNPEKKIVEAVEGEETLEITTEDESSDEKTSQKLWDFAADLADNLQQSIQNIKSYIKACRKAIDFDKSHNLGYGPGIGESDLSIKRQEKAIDELITSFGDIFFPSQFD